MHNGQKVILAIFFAYFTAYWAASSPQIRQLYSYAYEEPHAVAPTWEAAARGEYFARCANNFAMGISQCSTFGAVLESLPIRIAAALAGRKIPTQQTEWVDPWMQWLVVWVHGLITVLLLWGGFFVLRKISAGHFWYPFLFLILLSSNMEFSGAAFSVRPDGEMAGAIFLLFLLAWHQLLSGPVRAYWPGILAGVLVPIKLPVFVPALLGLRHRKAILAFAFLAGFLMLGMFRTSYEVFAYPRNAILSANLGGLGTSGYSYLHASKLETIWQNLLLYTDRQFWFIPLAIAAWAATFLRVKNNSKKSDYIYFAALTLLLLVPFKTENGQARFLVGFTAIFLALSVVGLHKWLPKRGLLFCCAFGMLQLVQQVPRWQNFAGLTHPEIRLAPTEKTLLALLEQAPVYLDERLLFNIDHEPFAAHRDKIQLVDPLAGNMRIPPGSVFITHCYPIDRAGEIGLASFGSLAESIREQCGPKEQISLSSLTTTYFRLRPDFPDLKMVVIHAKKELGVQPILFNGTPIRLAASYFRPHGYFVKNYFSQISNQEAFPGANDPSLEKAVAFRASGNYTLTPEIQSRYRSEESKLVLSIDGEMQSSCSIGTAAKVPYPPMLPHVLYKPWAYWRAVFLPVECPLAFRISRPGTHNLSLKIESQESRGQLNFFDLTLTKQ